MTAQPPSGSRPAGPRTVGLRLHDLRMARPDRHHRVVCASCRHLIQNARRGCPLRSPDPVARLALAAGASARWASRVTGRGAGAMIGGLVAMTLDRSILRSTRGGAAHRRRHRHQRQVDDHPDDRGRVRDVGTGRHQRRRRQHGRRSGRRAGRATAPPGWRPWKSTRCTCRTSPTRSTPASSCCSTCRATSWTGSARSTSIERTLRAGLARHPKAVVVANCDDVLMTSAAYDSPNVVWVAAGGAWANDSVSCPRSGEVIVRDGGHWYSTGADFKRPSPHWWFDDDTLYGPDGLALPMRLALPGAVNRGNAAQAVAAAVALGADPAAAVAAVSAVDEVAGRYRTVRIGQHDARILLAKNPAGWQEALSMVDKHAAGWSSPSTGRCPTARTCRGCGTCASSTSRTRQPSLPPANAAPTWRCGWGTPASSTRWCTTPWRPSRPARPGASRSSPTTPRSCSCSAGLARHG